MTTASCDKCHSTTGWLPANFTHESVSAGSCLDCHGSTATGKPSGHIKTIASCDVCHLSFNAWLPAAFVHSNPPGTCSTCHNGSTATGKTATHIVTSATCDTCHNTVAWKPALFKHVGVAGTCSNCHNGTNATGKRAGHISTSAQCDSCHMSTTSWTTVQVNHSNLSAVTNCADCHAIGWGATAQPGNHLFSINCSTCHRTTTWLSASYPHTGSAAQTCSTCHVSGPATGTPNGHWVLRTGYTTCGACHRTSSWIPVSAYSHTGSDITNGYVQHSGPPACKSCHVSSGPISGAMLSGPLGNHNCALCHTSNFRAGSHVKTQSPNRVLYTASELHDCSGACHEYTTSTSGIIKTSRTGHHHSTDGGF